jgi:transcriptional regulator
VIDERADTLCVVKATAAEFEKNFGNSWDMTDSLGYFDRLLPGVGAFRVSVTT